MKLILGRASGGHFRAMGGLVVLAALLVADVAAGVTKVAPRRLKACVVWLNEPHEVEVFRSQLDPRRFELIDIRAKAAAARPNSPAAPGGTGTDWLMDACTPDVSCKSCHGTHDVVAARKPSSRFHPSRVSETCRTCHAEVHNAYTASAHGQAARQSGRQHDHDRRPRDGGDLRETLPVH